MGKMQPNFSWQKYQDDAQDRANQFQYQLQQMHIVAANSVNATIDDISYWTQERPTGETWIGGQQIYTKTLTGTIVGAAITPYAIGATIKTLVSITGTFQDAVPFTIDANPLPYLNSAGNTVGIWASNTQVFIDANDPTFDGYTFYITLKYLK